MNNSIKIGIVAGLSGLGVVISFYSLLWGAHYLLCCRDKKRQVEDRFSPGYTERLKNRLALEGFQVGSSYVVKNKKGFVPKENAEIRAMLNPDQISFSLFFLKRGAWERQDVTIPGEFFLEDWEVIRKIDYADVVSDFQRRVKGEHPGEIGVK